MKSVDFSKLKKDFVESVDFSILEKSWPSPFVARSEIYRLTGGLLNARRLANLDCLGLGPANRFRVGRKICYPVSEIIKFLERHQTAV